MSVEYLTMFVDETREHLQAWSDGLMRLEKTNDLSVIPTIFRAAHTIKGMAMTMGFQRMGEITHSAENLLDDVRNGRLTMSTPVVDALLHGLDHLETLLDDIESSGQERAMDVSEVLRALTAARKGPNEKPSTVKPTMSETDRPLLSAERKVAEEAIRQGYRVFEITIGFDKNCVMPLARFQQWLQRIDQNQLLSTTPDATILDAGDYSGEITAVIATREDMDEVGETLMSVSEIIPRSVHEWLLTGETYQKTGNLLPENRNITDDPHVRTVISKVLEEGKTVLEVGIRLAQSCRMKAARMFMVFEAVGGHDQLLFCDPHITKIEAEEMDHEVLFVCYANESADVIQTRIQSILEVSLVELREWLKTDAGAIRGENLVSTNLSESAKTEKRKTSTIRVDTGRLDDLMNLVSELVIDKTRLERIRTEVEHQDLSETIDHMSRLSNELQELIMSIRMIPVESVFNRFPRMVRDTAQSLNKQIEFVMTGEATELDRTVVEEIGDPILHMLRNSLDHGIESAEKRRIAGKPPVGRIELRAYSAGNHVFIEVEDDGGGIPREKVLKKARERGIVGANDVLTDHQVNQLLFASGFSTADQISDLSGRGVGLDVVRTKIEALSGKIDVYSEEGRGTKFVIRLPMTLAIMDGLMVRIGNDPYLIPIGSISETGRLGPTRLLHGKEVVVWRGQVVPIVRAQTVFGQDGGESSAYVVFVSRGERVVGIAVDELVGQFEVVLKSLDAKLKKIPYFAGATILGDGEVSLILDANAFME